MSDRFLIYIDLLGFSEIVHHKVDLLPIVFQTLDDSNAYKHGSFKVIQFSDTVLVFNDWQANSRQDKNYCAMFLCEFAQEIQLRLHGGDIFLRALVTRGPFHDSGEPPNQNYKHLRAFWGTSLIKAYQAEKEIQAVGVFVDETIRPYMSVFETHLYDKENGIWFVDTTHYLRQSSYSVNAGAQNLDFSCVQEEISTTHCHSFVAHDLVYLRRLFEHGHDARLPPRIRIKYLQTWEFYRQKYKRLCLQFEQAEFDVTKVLNIDLQPFIDEISAPFAPFLDDHPTSTL